MNQRVVAVIPCLNEERSIENIVVAASRCCDLVVVSDDGSTDGTVTTALLAGAYVLTKAPGEARGIGANTRRGINAAIRLGADIVVTLDGDGQHDPVEIPLLLHPVVDGTADMVIGSRFVVPSPQMPPYRRLGTGVIAWVLNAGANRRFTDTLCGFRAFSKPALDILAPRSNGHGFIVETIIKARARSLRIVEVPISCIYHSSRRANSKMNPVWHGILLLARAIQWRLWETGMRGRTR